MMKREYHSEMDDRMMMGDPLKRMKYEGYAPMPMPPTMGGLSTYTPPQMAQPIPNPQIFQDLTIQSRVEIPASLRCAALRKGKWSGEEEVYAHRIICDFEDGLLDIPARTHLRTYLAAMLHCDQMRISKKFKGNDKVGKQIFVPIKNASDPENQGRILQARHTRQTLQQAWYVKLNEAERTLPVEYIKPQTMTEPNYDYLSHWRERAQYALCYSNERYDILSLMYEGRKIIDVLRHVNAVSLMRGAQEESEELQMCMSLYNDLVAKENLLRYNEINFMGSYAQYDAENPPTSSAQSVSQSSYPQIPMDSQSPCPQPQLKSQSPYPQAPPSSQSSYPKVATDSQSSYPQVPPNTHSSYPQVPPSSQSSFPQVTADSQSSYQQAQLKSQSPYPQVPPHSQSSYSQIPSNFNPAYPQPQLKSQSPYPQVPPNPQSSYPLAQVKSQPSHPQLPSNFQPAPSQAQLKSQSPYPHIPPNFQPSYLRITEKSQPSYAQSTPNMQLAFSQGQMKAQASYPQTYPMPHALYPQAQSMFAQAFPFPQSYYPQPQLKPQSTDPQARARTPSQDSQQESSESDEAHSSAADSPGPAFETKTTVVTDIKVKTEPISPQGSQPSSSHVATAIRDSQSEVHLQLNQLSQNGNMQPDQSLQKKGMDQAPNHPPHSSYFKMQMPPNIPYYPPMAPLSTSQYNSLSDYGARQSALNMSNMNKPQNFGPYGTSPSLPNSAALPMKIPYDAQRSAAAPVPNKAMTFANLPNP